MLNHGGAAEKVSCNKGAYPVNGVGKEKAHRLGESNITLALLTSHEFLTISEENASS